jgi:hypothetical protein
MGRRRATRCHGDIYFVYFFRIDTDGIRTASFFCFAEANGHFFGLLLDQINFHPVGKAFFHFFFKTDQDMVAYFVNSKQSWLTDRSRNHIEWL